MFSKSRSVACGQRRRMHVMTPTGNSAFDAYRDEMIQRLEDEKRSFEEFLERLREAKDKSEFDQFMDEREKKSKAEQNVSEDA